MRLGNPFIPRHIFQDSKASDRKHHTMQAFFSLHFSRLYIAGLKVSLYCISGGCQMSFLCRCPYLWLILTQYTAGCTNGLFRERREDDGDASLVSQDHLSQLGTQHGIMASCTSVACITRILRCSWRFHLSALVTWPRKISSLVFNSSFCVSLHTDEEAVDPHLNEKGYYSEQYVCNQCLFFAWLTLVEWKVKTSQTQSPCCQEEQNLNLYKTQRTFH